MRNAKESFTEMNKDGKVNDGIRIQMIQRNRIEPKKVMKKRGSWQT